MPGPTQRLLTRFASSLSPSFINKKNNNLAGYYTYPPSECTFYDTPARCPRDPVRFIKASYGRRALEGAEGHDKFFGLDDNNMGAWVTGASLSEDDVFEPDDEQVVGSRTPLPVRVAPRLRGGSGGGYPDHGDHEIALRVPPSQKTVLWRILTMNSTERAGNLAGLLRAIPRARTFSGYTARDARTLHFLHRRRIRIHWDYYGQSSSKGLRKNETQMMYGKLAHFTGLLDFLFHLKDLKDLSDGAQADANRAEGKSDPVDVATWGVFVEDDMRFTPSTRAHDLESFLKAVDPQSAPPLLRFGDGVGRLCGDGVVAYNIAKVDLLLAPILERGIYAPSDITYDGLGLAASVCRSFPMLAANHGSFKSLIRHEASPQEIGPAQRRPPGFATPTQLNIARYNRAIDDCTTPECEWE